MIPDVDLEMGMRITFFFFHFFDLFNVLGKIVFPIAYSYYKVDFVSYLKWPCKIVSRGPYHCSRGHFMDYFKEECQNK